MSMPEKPNRRQIAATLVRVVASLPPGDKASLRRMEALSASDGAFWRLSAEYLEPLLPGTGPLRDQQEDQWACVLSLMARLSDLPPSGRRLGAALASAQFSDLRFSRLLRAEGQRLADEARGAVAFLVSKGEACDALDLTDLILVDGEPAESIRRRIARDFFHTQSTLSSDASAS